MLTSVWLLGVLMGFRHALEADHVMAMLALNADAGRYQAIVQGVIWGVGHTLTLLLVGIIFLSTDTLIPDRVAKFLELSVGVMLVALGIDVFRRLMKRRVHAHVHRHATGVMHFHLHAHDRDDNHEQDAHQHSHFSDMPLRTLLIGFIHGLSGSAVLILLTLQMVPTIILGAIYILLFGLGSIMGMALLSAVVSVPVNSLRKLKSWDSRIRAVIGAATVLFGAHMIYNQAIGLYF